MNELDDLVSLIDRYEARFGMTPLSLAVVTLSDADEARLARLMRRALLRGRPIPHRMLERYSEPASAVS